MTQYAYEALLGQIRRDGIDQMNRTGVMARTLPGAVLKFDLSKGFPAITTKRLAFNAVKGELIGFIRGYDNAADFRALGCNIWDANANENKAWLANQNRKGDDDLGRIYGVQWRDWRSEAVPGRRSSIDQLETCYRQIIEDPTNRRIIMNAWRPDEFDQMALPPCHVLYQFIPHQSTNKLHMCMYQRSCDMFLGVPFNIASSALLLSIMARRTGYDPGVFTHFLADAHIYHNHFDQVEEQLGRVPFEFPTLRMDSSEWTNEWESIQPHDIWLDNYNCHPTIKAPMAV